MCNMKKAKSDKKSQPAIHAGFPNPAVDSSDIPLDLNKLVVKNRASTFYMRVDGTFGEELNIHSGDILAIDRALDLRSGDIFVGTQDGEFVLRKFERGKSNQVESWGVVTFVIHKTRR